MLLDKVRATINKHGLINYGDSIICAVSGGADSVCLLHIMLTLRKEYNLKIYIANVNHLIRGEESDSDSAFVKKIARAADVELFYREYDVVKIAKERKIGEEECGRELRYEFFSELSKRLGGAKIATAHNLNDNAETILFRLVRGSAAQGLGGILYKRDNIVRPLLDISRNEIEKYLRENSLTWCEDSTNTMPIYARNKIRIDVMPYLREISSTADEKIVSAASLIAQDNEFVNLCAANAEKECVEDDALKICRFKTFLMPIKRRIAASMLLKWGVREITADKIMAFIEFTDNENGKIFDINGQFYAQKSYDSIVLCERTQKKALNETLDIGKALSLDSWRLSAIITDGKIKKTSNNMAVFDADKLSAPFNVTYRQDGDKMYVEGMAGSKKLSDIFSDAKVERFDRDFIPIVKKNDEIVYLCGLRQTSKYCPDENTKKYLIISYEIK